MKKFFNTFYASLAFVGMMLAWLVLASFKAQYESQHPQSTLDAADFLQQLACAGIVIGLCFTAKMVMSGFRSGFNRAAFGMGIILMSLANYVDGDFWPVRLCIVATAIVAGAWTLDDRKNVDHAYRVVSASLAGTEPEGCDKKV